MPVVSMRRFDDAGAALTGQRVAEWHEFTRSIGAPPGEPMPGPCCHRDYPAAPPRMLVISTPDGREMPRNWGGGADEILSDRPGPAAVLAEAATVEPMPSEDKPSRHRWGDRKWFEGFECADGNGRSERTCEHCGLVKITVHPPIGMPWRLWRTPTGMVAQIDATPPCVPLKADGAA